MFLYWNSSIIYRFDALVSLLWLLLEIYWEPLSSFGVYEACLKLVEVSSWEEKEKSCFRTFKLISDDNKIIIIIIYAWLRKLLFYQKIFEKLDFDNLLHTFIVLICCNRGICFSAMLHMFICCYIWSGITWPSVAHLVFSSLLSYFVSNNSCLCF